MRASRRPGIVIKFWRQVVRYADPRHDVPKKKSSIRKLPIGCVIRLCHTME